MYRILIFFSLIGFGILLFSCQKAVVLEEEIILVMIPPFVDPKLTDGENICRYGIWRYAKTPENIDIVKSCEGAPMPNDGGVFLQVILDKNGALTLNGEPHGDISDSKQLVKRLSKIFEEHEEKGVFEEGTWKVEKTVGVKIPGSRKFSELIEVARAVKESGADPIILLLDGHLQ